MIFILIDCFVLLIALIKVYCVLRNQRNLMTNEKFMTVHVIMVAFLAFSTYYLVYGNGIIITTAVSFVSGLLVNTVMAVIMLQVSGQVQDDLHIKSIIG